MYTKRLTRVSEIQCLCIKILTDKISSEEKERRKIQVSKENSDIISRQISYNENEIHTFLSSGSSYNNRGKARFAIYFESPQSAKFRTENSVQKIRSLISQKKKTHLAKCQVTHTSNKPFKNHQTFEARVKSKLKKFVDKI